MKHSRPLSIAGIAAFAAIALTLLLNDTKPDAANDALANNARTARTEVAYPPAYPSYPELPAAPAAAVQAKSKPSELCGFGPVNPELLPAALETEADSVILHVARDMARSGDDRARALGLATQAWVAGLAAERAIVAEDPVTCRETSLCDERAAQAFERAAQPAIDALVRVAGTTRDPHVYVTALRLCRTIVPDAPPAACSALAVEQWAQVDPDNAFPFLLIARDARNRKDSAAFEEALSRASRAKAFDRRATQYGRLVLEVDTRQEPVRTLILQKLAALDAREDPAEYFSNFTLFGQYCAKRDEPRRRPLCTDLAAVLSAQDSDRLGLQVGAAIAEQTGLLPDLAAQVTGHAGSLDEQDRPGRLAAARRERQALDTVARVTQARPEDLTCKAAAQTEAWVRGVATFGEREYLRQRAAGR